MSYNVKQGDKGDEDKDRDIKFGKAKSEKNGR